MDVEQENPERLLNWSEFATAQPEMAEFGEKRMQLGVMYLATIRKDGYPRVHPFTPFVGAGRLFAFMEPTSPKARDLLRDGRYSMHSLVVDWYGTNGEFQVGGDASLVADPASREAAVAACPYKDWSPVKETHLLFEFRINGCLTNYYADGHSNVKQWKGQVAY